MLITTCAHCNARFRVTPQQLNARQGQVRCGRCSQVFNGFQILERFPDDDTGGRLLAEFERREIAEPRATPASKPTAAAPSGQEAVDLPIFDEAPAAPAPAPQAADPPPAPEPPPQPVQASVPPPPKRRRWLRHEPDITLDMDPPDPPARAWRFAVALALVVLALEIAYAWRGPIAQRYPVLRPTLEAGCAYVGCTVPYSREESLLKLEDSQLLEVPGKPNEIALGARVRNLASVAQEYPYLELTLTDLTGQAAVRRVLRPTDYLGRPLAYGEVIPPGVEVTLQLRLETPRVKATGYQLLVFYP
ncbi:MAG TPA: DUF3426 domain-containing protein [Usitatibacter sp.]|nr:DUF3426 domain-containing protein [Usitatibacter sp.]